MATYKITKTENINAFANRKSNAAFKLLIVIFLFIFCLTVFTQKNTTNLISIGIVFLFVGVLFYVSFLGLKKLMWFLGKNITYILNDNTLQIQQNLDNETAIGFLAGYFYRKGKSKGGYRDFSMKFSKMKSVMKNAKGDLILKTRSITIGKIIIPRELENLRDLENQLRVGIKPNQ